MLSDFEQQLAVAWDRELLAVYGDHLQARDDPRGELIAIDLAGRPAESAARREELETRWLVALPRGARTGIATDCGFITDITLDNPALLGALVASPFAHQLRGLTLHGSGTAITTCLARLTTLPLLDRLALEQIDDVPSKPLIGDMTKLVAATPRLSTLVVDGRRVIGDFHHPTVHALVISGLDALAATQPLDKITSVDFALHRSVGYDYLAIAALDLDVLPSSRFPAMRHLDLSRNEPGNYAANHRGADWNPFLWLRGSKFPALTAVRMPSLRNDGHAGDLAALAKLRITLARAYRDSPDPPKGIAGPERRPWPPRDQVHGRDALSVKVAGHPYGEDVDLTGAVALMEQGFDTFPAECRAAWTEFWDFVADLGWEDSSGADIVMNLSTNVLLAALLPLPLDDERRWLDLRTLLAQRQSMGTLPEVVSIKRYWGW